MTEPISMRGALGAIKSPPDYRDIPYSKIAAANPVVLPKAYKVDISQLPVWMQNQLGACTGHATAKYAQYKVLKGTGRVVPLSARFPYTWAKCNDGIGMRDQGTYPRLDAQALTKLGCATEDTLPNNTLLSFSDYVFDADWSKVSPYAIEDALAFKIGGYSFFDTINRDLLKQAIFQNDGVSMLMQVGASMWTAANGQNSWSAVDLFPLRAPSPVESGHEVWFFGYEDSADGSDTTFYFLNSWSDEWGEKGVGWLNFSTYAPYLEEAMTFVDLPANMVAALKQLPSKETFTHQFTEQMDIGQRSAEVTALQTALMIDGDFGVGLYYDLLKNDELGYFGTITQQGVQELQAKYGIATSGTPETTGYGRVGPQTLAKLNSMF